MSTGKVNLMGAAVRMECETAFESTTGALRAINHYENGVREYVVYSYAQPIARVTYTIDYDDNGDVVTGRSVWITPDKFSVTTSKHTGIARRALLKSVAV
jgi:hypothetical protein